MKTLTPAERARRAAVLGVTVPAPAAVAPANGAAKPGLSPQPRPAGKLSATPAMQRAIGATPPPVSPPSPPSPPLTLLAPPPSPAEASEPPAAAEPARKRRRYLITPADYAVFRRVRALLQVRYPQIFSWARPLAIGIDQRLREALTEEELPTADLSVFLKIWVRRKVYRGALERGERRRRATAPARRGRRRGKPGMRVGPIQAG